MRIEIFGATRIKALISFGFIFSEVWPSARLGPSHPFWLGRQPPFVRIKIGNQSGLDLRFPAMSTIIGVEKLRSIGRSSSPCSPAARASRARRSPQDRSATVHHRADEVPLVAPKPSWSGNEEYRLLRVTHLDTEPPFVRTYHVRGKLCAGDFLTDVVVGPHNPES